MHIARSALRVLACAIAGVLGACSHVPRSAGSAWAGARQLVLVTTEDWNASRGTLRVYERAPASDWQGQDSFPVTIGRNGSAWGVGLHPDQSGPRKREGDGRSPAGVFAIGTAFGYASSVTTGLAYAPMDEGHWCIDDDASPLYNRIVDARDVGAAAVAGSTEPMRRDLHAHGDMRYALGFVIWHNPRGEHGAGSCIFAHVWRDAGTTAGCTAMEAAAMERLLAVLRADADPVFVLLPWPEYRRLQAGWRLPAVAQP
ncbi:MAG: L,D-transpeptidase family protein [Dokdonella sp.]|uniref:L,D-transpeptidase family protein n=1 Tax=Dokdonella sp. TaxID=2291710 RepID=UPI003F7E3A6E